MMPATAPVKPSVAVDPRAERVFQQLKQLQQVIRVQHPEMEPARAMPAQVMDEVVPADGSANTIAAAVVDDRT